MRLLLTSCLAALTIGCHSAPSGQQQIEPAYDQASGKLRELSYDADNNGRPDMKALMDGSDVRTVEVDENGDGKTDRWEYYQPNDESRPAGRARVSNDPQLVRIERATRHDGRITRTEGFANGALVWAEEDRDANGRIDRWEKYVDGTLSTLALDTLGRGAPNRVLTYVGESLQIQDK